MPRDEPKRCEWTNQQQAFAAYAGFTEKTQSAGHIKPLHWYVACRLVLEGGFNPDHIRPRPPFVIQQRKRKGRCVLAYDPASAGSGETTVLGGLKTKNVDVVVTNPRIGPVLAVSCKGTTVAFRNLTNRMEELIGDCTNLHISYPAMVMGYLHLLRANRAIEQALEEVAAMEEEAVEEPARALEANDLAFEESGEPIAEIKRFNNALERLAGRSGIRDDITRYESMALVLVETGSDRLGELFDSYPLDTSLLNLHGFFDRLYVQYDERFVYGAPLLASATRREEWSPQSPAFTSVEADYPLRRAAP
jgi:hypothetical protein